MKKSLLEETEAIEAQNEAEKTDPNRLYDDMVTGKTRKPRTTPKGVVTTCQANYDKAVADGDIGAANEAVIEALAVLKNEHEKLFIHINRVAVLKETWRKRYSPEV